MRRTSEAVRDIYISAILSFPGLLEFQPPSIDACEFASRHRGWHIEMLRTSRARRAILQGPLNFTTLGSLGRDPLRFRITRNCNFTNDYRAPMVRMMHTVVEPT